MTQASSVDGSSDKNGPVDASVEVDGAALFPETEDDRLRPAGDYQQDRGQESDKEGDQESIDADLVLVDKLFPSVRGTQHRFRDVSDRRYERRSAITQEMTAPDDISYHPGRSIRFFAPPQQRQKWGDTQVLPRVNWGDLFFDLFYVAAAYNTSNILVDSPSAEGLLYFTSTFFVVMQVWYWKTFFDSRYVVGDDLFHRIVEIAGLSALASAIVHVRPVSILSNSTDYPNIFVFCASMTIANLISLARSIELYFYGVGQREVLKSVSVRGSVPLLMSLVFLSTATIVAGIDFFGGGGKHEKGQRLMRILAGDGDAKYESDKNSGYDESSKSDVPIWLCLGSMVVYWLVYTYRVYFGFPGDGGDFKKNSVPVNVNFIIHRYAEWIMLMLGESILSLLIVDVDESTDYYLTFYSSLITVILLQYLHFRSQPHSAEDHALRRDKNAAIISVWFQFVYSAALIAFGSAVTLFVVGFANAGGRRLTEDGQGPRFLESSGNSAYDPYELRKRAAHLYSASLATILFSLDTLSILHVGFKRCNDCALKEKNKAGMLLVLARALTIVFVATLSQWTDDPETLSEIGAGVVIAQVIMRLIGYALFPKKVHVDMGHGHAAVETQSKAKAPVKLPASGSSFSSQV